MTTTHTRTCDIDGLVYVERARCDFDVTTETYPAEPYSWGESRGTETNVEVRLVAVHLGGLRLTREQAVLAFGSDAVADLEDIDL